MIKGEINNKKLDREELLKRVGLKNDNTEFVEKHFIPNIVSKSRWTQIRRLHWYIHKRYDNRKMIVNANMYAIKILFQFYEVFGILHIKHFKTRIILSKMQSIIVKKHVFAIKHIALLAISTYKHQFYFLLNQFAHRRHDVCFSFN